MEKINYKLKEKKEKIKIPENLGFGKIFTDHMFVMDYDEKKGWHNPVIQTCGKFVSSPRNNVFSLRTGNF